MKNKIESVIEQLKKAYSDDLPKTYNEVFRKAAEEFIQEHDHQNLCSLLSFCLVKSMPSNTDFIQSAEEAITIAEQEDNKAMIAVYHMIAGKAFSWNYKEPQEHFDKALTDPKFLASVRTDDFKWLIKESDSKIFGNDLLSFIGIKTDRYDVMYDYYKTTDNRMAACYSRTHMVINEAIPNKQKYAQLMDVIEQYGDLPVVCEAVKYICERNLMQKTEEDTLDAENEYAERKYDFIKPFVDKFANDKHTKELEVMLRELDTPSFKSDFDEVVVPNKCFSVPLKYRNIDSITITAYPTSLTGRDKKELTQSYKSYLTKETPVYSKTYHLEKGKPCITMESQLEIGGLPLGIYLIEMKSDHGDKGYNFLHVSNVIAIAEHLPYKRTRIVVVDNMTGHPIPHAMVDVGKGWNDRVNKTLTCNKNGEVVHWYVNKHYAPGCIFPYTDEDKFCPKESISSWNVYHYEGEENLKKSEIITDRAIYRPGQTIHVAVVTYEVDKQKNVKTLKESVKLQLYKHYNECIGSCKIKTNDLGVAHCDFVIPEDADSGRYIILCEHGDKEIRIEEYKRPSFEVKMEEYAQPYKVGDTITLEGEACSYAGVPVANAKVNYRVKRVKAYWWYFLCRYWEVEGLYGRYGEHEIYEGTASTDENGHFHVEVPMLLEDSNGKAGMTQPMFMDIITEADVIDTTGEMQSARISLPLSNKEYFIHIQMNDKTELSENLSFVAVIKNATGQDLDGKVDYWINEDMHRSSASANQSISLPKLETGKYTLHVKYGEEEQTHEFIVFNKNATKSPCETEMWTYQSAEVFPEDGGEVILQVGCSDKDSYLIYNVFSGGHILESGAEYVASGMINRRFSYKKEYGNGIVVSYAWVKNKKMQTCNFTITKPIPKRELKLTWKTLRDKVTPGSLEKWILTVKDKEGRNVTANVIATLYDKSLDQLVKNSWNEFGPELSWNVPSTKWDFSIGSIHIQFHKKLEKVYSPYHFSSFLYESLAYALMEIRRYKVEERRCRYDIASPRSAIHTLRALGSKFMSDEDAGIIQCACSNLAESIVEDSPVEEIKLRSDMSETAFFMPTLRTDENGDVSIEFVLPDSLTTWKFKAIAHTQDMYHTYFEDETIARKLVMVKPNMPRFVRVGDDSTISAKVTNTSENEISGKIVFELLNASDERVVFSDSKPFTLSGNASLAESFQFTPDEEIEDYICKIYAVGNGFSDGEQHPLQVLSNKTEVTVTHIISQDGPGTEQIDTARLLPGGSTRRHLSLQYTNKPIWLTIKALPAMTNEASDDAISVSVSLYCNLLTAYLQKHVKEYDTIVSVNPRKLEKSTNKLIGKLQKLQGRGGGFKWFKDMPESLYMTSEVLMHLSRLQMFVGEMDALESIVKKAFRFCDAEMCEWVQELKKREKEGKEVFMPTFTVLQHMYNCAITGHVLDNEAKKAYDYLVPLLMKDIHRQTIREKAMSAVILEYAGHHNRAQVYAESLRQYTKCDAERGRTFDTPRATYSWYSYKIPTHVAGMEALHMLCPQDRMTFREMQKWLLQEKRTQAWDTPIDSVNAVHALLIGSEEVLSDNGLAVFHADGRHLDVVSNENEGYVEAELPASTKKLSVEKYSKSLSWGAVFARFLQPLSEVESSGSGMTIKREIITDKKELHVGDRIKVKLTYACERDFDFVTVIDSKAACMEPVNQLSWSDSFKHVEPRDTETRYFYYGLAEGSYSIVTEYYLDRPGVYEIGVATIVCTYAPEFRAMCPSENLVVIG